MRGMSLRLVAAFLLALLLAAPAARAELKIIDFTHRNERRRPRTPAAPAVPDLHVLMNGSETSRNLSIAVHQQLQELGYVVTPEVDYDAVKDGRSALALLRFEIVRLDGSCFVTAKVSELKTPTSPLWKWETTDDLQPCSNSLRTAIEALAAARPPSRPRPAGLDAGTPDSGGAEPPDAAQPAPQRARVVLGETVLAAAAPAPADEPAAGEPQGEEPTPAPAKSCGCGAGAEPLLAAGLLAAFALARRRR